MNGPVLGCWEGTVKVFPDSQEASIVTWKDRNHPDDPIRGLLVTEEGTIVVANDFGLHFLQPDLTALIKTIPAKEADTCKDV